MSLFDTQVTNSRNRDERQEEEEKEHAGGDEDEDNLRRKSSSPNSDEEEVSFRIKSSSSCDVNEEEEDIYDKTIKYTYETPDGKKVDREITYGSVISQGDEHPLYKQIRKEIDDYKLDKKEEK